MGKHCFLPLPFLPWPYLILENVGIELLVRKMHPLFCSTSSDSLSRWIWDSSTRCSKKSSPPDHLAHMHPFLNPVLFADFIRNINVEVAVVERPTVTVVGTLAVLCSNVLLAGFLYSIKHILPGHAVLCGDVDRYVHGSNPAKDLSAEEMYKRFMQVKKWDDIAFSVLPEKHEVEKEDAEVLENRLQF